MPEPGFDPRGVDIDGNGVVWTALAASSHLASFDRRRCTGAVGRKADGSECREGWTLYSRGLDGRIDQPGAGWKGRALYADYGTHFVWHIEGGKGTKGKLVKFRLRPDPLAR